MESVPDNVPEEEIDTLAEIFVESILWGVEHGSLDGYEPNPESEKFLL